MEKPQRASSIYKLLGLSAAVAVMCLAIAVVILRVPMLVRQTPTQRLAGTLAHHLPGTQPQVTRTGTAALRIVLQVSFDPTVDAEQAHRAFQQALAVAKAQRPPGVSEIEIELNGISLEGTSTTASKSFQVTDDGHGGKGRND